MDLETAADIETVVSIQPNHSGLSVVIHPLALLNITDHFTRIQVQATAPNEHLKAIGVLLGTQAGRKISICNSFEVKVDLSHDEANSDRPEIIVDETYLCIKQEHIKQVFPKLDAIGWYSVGTTPTLLELDLQEKYFQPRIDSPLFLQFNARALLNQGSVVKPSLKNRTDLPLAIYEPFYDVKRTIFIEVPDYAVETESTQRMALAAMAQAEGASIAGPVPMEESDSSATQDSPLLLHLSRQKATVSMLQSRIKLLMAYLQDVASGALPSDHGILREINSLIAQLPHSQAKETQESTKATSNLLYREFNDVLLGSYLSSLTECSSHLVDLASAVQALRLTSLRSKTVPVDAGPKSRNRASRFRH